MSWSIPGGSDFSGPVNWTFGAAGSAEAKVELEVIQPRNVRGDAFVFQPLRQAFILPKRLPHYFTPLKTALAASKKRFSGSSPVDESSLVVPDHPIM